MTNLSKIHELYSIPEDSCRLVTSSVLTTAGVTTFDQIGGNLILFKWLAEEKISCIKMFFLVFGGFWKIRAACDTVRFNSRFSVGCLADESQKLSSRDYFSIILRVLERKMERVLRISKWIMERKYNFRQCRNGLWKGLGVSTPESWDLRDLLWKKEKGMEKGKNYGKGCRP